MEELQTGSLVITKSTPIFTEEDITEIGSYEFAMHILLILMIMFYSIFKK